MSLILDALALALPASLLLGLIVLGAARLAERTGQPLGPNAWRFARLIILLPFIAGPVLSQIPVERLIALPPVELSAEAVTLHPELQSVADPEPRSAGIAPATILVFALWGLYAAGLGAALFAAIRRHGARKRLIAKTRAPSQRLSHMLGEAAALIDVKTPQIRVSEGVNSAVLTGWSGLILVAPALERDPHAARHVLLHELIHFQRGDERDRLTGTALKILFWFHWPLRQVEQHLDVAREIACDAGVITVLGRGAAKPYAATLIGMMKAPGEPASAFGADSRRFCEMRIKALMSGRSNSRRTSLAFLLMAGLIASPVALAQSALTDRVERFVPVYMPAVSETLGDVPAPQPVIAAVPPAGAVEVRPMRVAESAALIAGDAVLVAPQPPQSPIAAVAEIAEISAPVGEVSTFSTPVTAGGRISSLYGNRPSRPGDSPKFHHGVDIAGPTGTPVQAVGDGIITHAQSGYNGHSAWGNTVVIDHGDGWETLYAHLHDFEVQVGDRISAGDVIGGMGATGRATGPHVHVEVRHNGERIDPSGHIPGIPARD